MTDPRTVKRWQPDVREYRLLTPGDLQTGSRARITVKEYEHIIEIEMRVVAMVQNEHYSYEMTHPGFTIHGEFRLADAGNSTRVEHAVEVKFRGLRQLLMPLFRGRLRRKMESRLALLRDLAEDQH